MWNDVGLAEHPRQSAKPRTPAQAQASRVNGARSRGPKTPEGKEKSRQNALKHGLLSRVLRPASDHRGLGRAYRQIRDRLFEQYKPKRVTDQLEIESLALDYVRAARARALIQAYWEVDTPSETQAQDLRIAKNLDNDVRLLCEVKERLEAGDPLGCTWAQAVELARGVSEEVSDQVEEARSAGEWLQQQEDNRLFDSEGEDGGPGVDEEVELNERGKLDVIQAFLQELGEAVETYCSQRHVVSLLTAAELDEDDRRRLLAVFQRIAPDGQPDGYATAVNRLRRQSGQRLVLLAEHSDQLVRLEQYLARIERTIARKLRNLAGRTPGFVCPKTRRNKQRNRS